MLWDTTHKEVPAKYIWIFYISRQNLSYALYALKFLYVTEYQGKTMESVQQWTQYGSFLFLSMQQEFVLNHCISSTDQQLSSQSLFSFNLPISLHHILRWVPSAIPSRPTPGKHSLYLSNLLLPLGPVPSCPYFSPVPYGLLLLQPHLCTTLFYPSHLLYAPTHCLRKIPILDINCYLCFTLCPF